MYKVYMCLNGMKNKCYFYYIFETKEEFEEFLEENPFDIIDATEMKAWVDYGDE